MAIEQTLNGSKNDNAGLLPEGVDHQANALPILIETQYIKDFSFENPKARQAVLEGGKIGQSAVNLAINIDPLQSQADAAAEGADKRFEVILSFRIENTIAGNAGVETQFLLELQYGGVVNLKNVAAQYLQPILFIEVPRLLFPFARQIIATTVREGGYPSFMLNPIDFADLYRRRMEAMAKQRASEADSESKAVA